MGIKGPRKDRRNRGGRTSALTDKRGFQSMAAVVAVATSLVMSTHSTGIQNEALLSTSVIGSPRTFFRGSRASFFL